MIGSNKKGIIKSISNREKTFWIRIDNSNENILLLNEIMIKLENHSEGLEFYNNKKGNYMPSIEEIKDLDTSICSEGINIIFCNNQIKIILLKNHTKYQEFHETLLKYFEMKNNNNDNK